jgi:cellulose synthase/poly-beta-1,6-N-acetylglucosamine synthase-like glycosyltransferase
MDGDSRLAPDTLRHAVRHFADARVAAVAGNVKVVNRHNLWSRLQALEYIEGLNLPRRAQGFMHAVTIIPGPLGMFRRDVLAAVGGYDTDTYAEDADLTLKILTAGWHVVYEERAIAWTEAPELLLDLIKQRYRWTRGILQALGKRPGWLIRPRRGSLVWLSLSVMFFEAILWPAMNVLGNLLFVVATLYEGSAAGVFYWWGAAHDAGRSSSAAQRRHGRRRSFARALRRGVPLLFHRNDRRGQTVCGPRATCESADDLGQAAKGREDLRNNPVHRSHSHETR